MALDDNSQYGPVDSVKMNDVDEPNKHHSYRMIIITVIVILIAIGGFIIAQNENLQQTMKRTLSLGGDGGESITGRSVPDVTESSIASRDRSWMEIVPEKSTYTTSETVTLTINGYTEGRDITGYDVLLTLDTDIFELQSVSTAIPGFTVFPFDNDGYIAITAIKDIGENEPTILDGTEMLTVELKPKKKGTGVISIALENDKEKTQFVDVNVEVLVPQIGSAQVEIQ